MMEPKSSSKGASLAPGFRFHPTDEELVRYYLRRKICGKPFRVDAISEIDIYKSEPWDLPGMSKLKSRDLEWYFFSVLDKKYGNGSRTNRATERGYWKTTGKDRAVYHRSQIVGMKKTLVYHSGRAPKGERSNWVMHEYRLIDPDLDKAGIVQDSFVLCRVFQKSGSGPKNGEQYGAPFVEEEWEDDELEMVPKPEAAEEVEVGEDAYLDGNDLDQILGPEIPSPDAPAALNDFYGDTVNHGEETVDSTDDSQKLLVGTGEYYYAQDNSDDGKLIDQLNHLPVQCGPEAVTVKREYIGESSKSVSLEDVDFLLDEPFLDATDNFHFGDGAFLETNDLSNAEANPSGFDMLEEYLTYFDADEANSQYMVFDPSVASGNEEFPSEQPSEAQKLVNEEAHQQKTPSGHLGQQDDAATSSKQDYSKFGSDMQYPFIKQASRMLGSFPAPPAFASEFPTKDAVQHLSSVSQSSSSVRVTAGLIQIRNMTPGGVEADWSLGKHMDYNIILSFGLSHDHENSAGSDSIIGLFPGKNASATSRGWFYFIFLWVLILSLSFKVGTYVCAR